ncbi:MAG: quinol:cytochrome C oxidoreductase [Myxococcales bacterium]|nr:MAG: quinol:cytochrome C oxidoreductase [Myxococcales bacterium]
MSVAKQSISSSDYRIPKGDVFASLWKAAFAVCLVGALGCFVAYGSNPERFAFSYLFAFLSVLFLALGSLFFILIQHLTSASWGVTTRRTAEFFAAGIPILALLFLPVAASISTLYPWHAKDTEHHVAQAHSQAADQGEHGHAEVHGSRPHNEKASHLAHEGIVAKKTPFLNESFFLLRAGLYFLIWIFLALRVFRLSTQQDEDRDLRKTVKLQNMAAPSIILFGLSLTFAAFDWIMSLEPAWFSTIFGVYLFATSAVAIFATVIVVTLSFRSRGFLKNAVNVEHYHDLGKLMFGFVIFWAYIGFSQLLLICYAGIPEEATFYHLRWDGGAWQQFSLFLLVGHFFFPFALILSRNVKRTTGVLGFAASWLLIMHVMELYWFVMPNAPTGGFSPHWMDVTCLLFVGGLYGSVVLWQMTRHPLIPIGDPRLERSLHFENA